MQNTIADPIEISGIGIHSGETVKMKLIPAGINSGIVFRSSAGESVQAKFDNVQCTNMSTKLSNGSFSVDVVEHLMAALWGSSIDNLIMELDGNEVPILDGSAVEFMTFIKKAGLKQLDAKRNIFEVTQTITVCEDDKFVTLSPNKNGLTIDMSIDFEHPAIGKQQIIFNGEDFEKQFAPARTFGFVKDLEYLHRNGLGLGASLENCIGVDEDGIANAEGLRFTDEFVRHKVLDCIGDLFLSGCYLHCHVKAHKTGHKLNNLVLRKLFGKE
jgi:UDP-3-O-[3-hydroxymyristoyl] N-acetylglucosamine deacetylase